MTKRIHQTGHALTIIVIIITIGLFGVLGYVAWNKFLNPANPETPAGQEAAKVNSTPAPTTTFSSDVIGISFSYPEEWVKLECPGNPSVVYFGSDIRGVGNGNQSLLCGGGSDFPAQMSFAVVDDFVDEAFNSKPVTIDGVEATKSVFVATEGSIRPAGFEVTKYIVLMKNGKTAVFTYSKWPESESSSYDTSNQTREAFKRLVETSLTLN